MSENSKLTAQQQALVDQVHETLKKAQVYGSRGGL